MHHCSCKREISRRPCKAMSSAKRRNLEPPTRAVSPEGSRAKRSHRSVHLRSCDVGAYNMHPHPMRSEMPLLFPQRYIECAIKSMFPVDTPLTVPILEDLLNQSPFTDYLHSFAELGDLQSMYPPAMSTCRWQAEASLGLQAGAGSSNRALPSLVRPGGGPWDHLHQALEVARSCGTWTNFDLEAEPDLHFAAAASVQQLRGLKGWRRAVIRKISELERRCRPLAGHLRAQQHKCVRSVRPDINVAFIAVLILVMRWPDRMLPFRFTIGFRIAGAIEASEVFPTICGRGGAHKSRPSRWGRGQASRVGEAAARSACTVLNRLLPQRRVERLRWRSQVQERDRRRLRP